MSYCKVENCESSVVCKQYCLRHYKQQYKYGRVLSEQEKHDNLSNAQKLKKPTLGKHWKIKDTSRMTGKHPRSEFKKGREATNKGIPLSKETKAKISAKLVGRTPWNKGTTGLMPRPWNKVGDGVTKKNEAERVTFKRHYQHKVFERDNYTCQICDQYSGYLQVDHIKQWSKHPELRFDLNNCRTLCMACHYYITFKRKIPDGVIWGHNLSRRIA